MSLLSLIARLSLNASGFEKGLKDARSATDKWGDGLASSVKNKLASAFGAYAILKYTKAVFDNASQLKDWSEQMDLSTGEVQRLQHAATQVGLEFSNFATSLDKLGASRAAALDGNAKMIESFSEFGVTLAELANPAKRNLDIMKEMSERIKTMTLTPAQRQDMRELLGREGGKVSAAMREGLGKKRIFEIPPEDIKAMDSAKKDLEKLGRMVVFAGGRLFGAALRPRAIFGANPEGAELDKRLREINRAGELRKAAMFGVDKGMDLFAFLRGLRIKTIPKVEGEDEKHSEKFRGRPEDMDSRIRLGGFGGAGKDVIADLSREQVKNLKLIVRNTSRITDGTGGIP